MIYNDYVEVFNLQLSKLKRLEELNNAIDHLLLLETGWSESVLAVTLNGNISATYNNQSNSYANELIENTRGHIRIIRETLIGIDFMEFGEILSEFQSCGVDAISEETKNIVNEFKKSYSVIHNYKKFTDNEEKTINYSALINALKEIKKIIEKFEFLVKYSNIIRNQLYNYDNNGIEIRLLNDNIEVEHLNNVMKPVDIMYKKLCEIGNINITEEQLKIIKVESGSLFVKFIGNEKILKIVAKILETFHIVYVKNFSKEGQKKNLVESTEIFTTHLDLIKEMKEIGIDVNEHEDIAKETLVLLMKQSNILLSSSPDIRVNDKILSKSKDLKDTLLKSTDYAGLIKDEQNK